MSECKQVYQQMYAKMFNTMTDTIERFQKLQAECEEEYVRFFENEEDEKVVQFTKKQLMTGSGFPLLIFIKYIIKYI